MIAPLRRGHRLVFAILALLLPLLLVLGLVVRRPTTAAEPLAPELATSPPVAAD